MIGRGLRTVNPGDHPGLIKRDCVVLDFGTSILTHGNIEAGTGLEGKEEDGEKKDPGEAPTKVCPETKDSHGIHRS